MKRAVSNRALAVLIVGSAPMMIRAVLLPFIGVPQPRVQDEFSHLLVADTFAHGRLANPQHPRWIHFESMHIVVRPVYASAYPVAPGLAMAAAQVVTGQPWLGVWLSVGVMSAAICWMLQGWMPLRWALLGGLIAAGRWGVLSFWMNSYYGGAVAATGGALVLGAVPRLLIRGRGRRPARDAALFAAGVVILANSRPYEGAIFCAPFVAALLFAVWQGRVPRMPVLVPFAAVLAISGAAMAFYFAGVTGDPLRLPYAFYRSEVGEAPHFIWQSPRTERIHYHRVTKEFYQHWEMVAYSHARANRSPYGVWDKAKSYWRFFIGPFLTLALIGAFPWLWRNRRTRLLVTVAIIFAVSLAVEVWHSAQYAAPAAGLMILITIQALRHVRLAKYGRLLTFAIAAAAMLTPIPLPTMSGENRARILDHLRSIPGTHLAIVRYARHHDVGDEWVYNSAGIDGARVVWAREMDPGSNDSLRNYFAGRQVWLVEPDLRPPRLSPYDSNPPPNPPFQFVRLGVEHIDVLRRPAEVKRLVWAKATEGKVDIARLGCDHWNYYFTAVTGVEAPDAAGCYTRDRSEPVTFERWFDWLSRQH